MSPIIKIAIKNAFGTVAYIVLVVFCIFYIGNTNIGQKNPTILIPIFMLMLFVLSATVTAGLMLGRPLLWYLDGKKKEALALLGYTVSVFFIIFTSLFIIWAISATFAAPASAATKAPTQSVTAAPVPPFRLTSTDRGMWVWGSAPAIVRESAAQDAFIKFALAPQGDTSARITRVFLSGHEFNFSSKSEVAKLRSFLKRAHENKLAVEFLTGDAKWVRTAEMKNVSTRVDKVIAFNAGTKNTTERFDGIHLDIEPYELSEWKTKPTGVDGYNDGLEKNYLDIFKNARAKIKASGQNMTLSADVPTWYSTKVNEMWPRLTGTDTPVSYLTIMNYFDSEKNFLYGYGGANQAGGVGPNLKASGATPLMFGAETQDNLEVGVSFGTKGLAMLEATFDAAIAKFGETKNFGGIAVHHYDVYMGMK